MQIWQLYWNLIILTMGGKNCNGAITLVSSNNEMVWIRRWKLKSIDYPGRWKCAKKNVKSRWNKKRVERPEAKWLNCSKL